MERFVIEEAEALGNDSRSGFGELSCHDVATKAVARSHDLNTILV